MFLTIIECLKINSRKLTAEKNSLDLLTLENKNVLGKMEKPHTLVALSFLIVDPFSNS